MKTKGWGEVIPAGVVEGLKFLASYIDEVMHEKESDVRKYLNGIRNQEFKVADWHKYYETNELPNFINVLLPNLDIKNLVKKPSDKGLQKIFSFVEMIQEQKNINISLAIKAIIEKFLSAYRAEFRWLVYYFVSIMNYGIPINLLYKKAREGDDEALFKLIRLDNSIIGSDFFKERLRRAEVTNERSFWTRLSNVIKEPKISTKYKWIKVAIIAACLRLIYKLSWDQIHDFLYREEIVDSKGSLSVTDIRKLVSKFSKRLENYITTK